MGYLKLKFVLQHYFPTPNINYSNLNYFTRHAAGALRRCPQFLAMIGLKIVNYFTVWYRPESDTFSKMNQINRNETAGLNL